MSVGIFEARRRQVEAARQRQRGAAPTAGGMRSTSPPQRRLDPQAVCASRRMDVQRAREAQGLGHLSQAAIEVDPDAAA